MVKGVSRSGASSSQRGTTPPQPLPTMQTGQNPHDPLIQLNSHLGYSAMAGVDLFTEMGLNPNDPNMVRCVALSPLPPHSMFLLTVYPPPLPRTAPNDDELARVPAADVRRHVKPSHPRPDHRAEPTTGSYGSPSQSLPERQVPRADVRYPRFIPPVDGLHADSDFT